MFTLRLLNPVSYSTERRLLLFSNVNLGDIDGNGKDDIININVPEFDLAKLAGADDGKGNAAENTLVMAPDMYGLLLMQMKIHLLMFLRVFLG